jgi:hypothetical protein
VRFLVLPLSVALALPLGAQKSAAAERDQNAIVDEQALLERQLDRLKSTMEVLHQRIEARAARARPSSCARA